jgi:hypothetical protein
MVGPVIDLDRTYGPFSGRVWGLILNFASNAVALYGITRYLRDGTHFGLMALGVAATVASILVLSRPVR